MSALLEDDWYREAYELREKTISTEGTNIFLFLDNAKIWKTITQNNIRKKVYRPCIYFKDNIWLILSNKKKTTLNVTYILPEDMETYLSLGILIRKSKLSELPNLWRE